MDAAWSCKFGKIFLEYETLQMVGFNFFGVSTTQSMGNKRKKNFFWFHCLEIMPQKHKNGSKVPILRPDNFESPGCHINIFGFNDS